MTSEPLPSTESTTDRRVWLVVAGWIVAAFAGRLLLSSVVPLLPDETYYWEWTRRLAAGYFDHPPGIALLISAGVGLLGNTLSGVRTGPAVAAIITHLVAVFLAWSLSGRQRDGAQAAARAAVLVALLPIAAIGLVPATPDAALFSSAMLVLACVERALASPLRSGQSTRWWLAAGVALGAAFIAKYTAVLLPAGLLLACLLHPALRARFREPGPWLAAAIAALMISPVIVWNAAREWISFRFQLGHGLGVVVRGHPIGRELELVGGQLALASPIIFVLLAATVLVAIRDGWRTRGQSEPTDPRARRFALGLMALVTFAFFAVSAWRRTVEPNWPALIYPGAVALLASSPATWARARAWRSGLVLAAVLLVAATLQAWRPLLPIPARNDPFGRAHGWGTLATAVDAARIDPFLGGATNRWVAADRYQDASELAFHLAGQPTVFSLNLGGRSNQYDLWPTVNDKVRPGDGLVAVFDANAHGDGLAMRVGAWFETMRQGETVRLSRGDGVITERRIWSFRVARNVPPPSDHRPTLSDAR